MMNPDEMEAAINKIRYHIRILADTIDYKKHPIESLIVQMDWNEDEIGEVHDIFEKWDSIIKSDSHISSAKFESDFRAIGIDYQSLKSVVLAFYRNGQWVDVCQAYVDSFNGTPAMEYHSIMRRERL